MSVDVFVDGLPNSATLTIKIFNHFIKKHLIKFKYIKLLQNLFDKTEFWQKVWT